MCGSEDDGSEIKLTEDTMAQKMVVVCNGDEPKNIMPTLVFATSGLALDYEVHVIFLPTGSKWAL